VASGRVTLLANSPAAEVSPLFAPDGKSVAVLVSDNPPTWSFDGRIYLFPVAGGAPKILSPVLNGQAMRFFGWSPNGQLLYFHEAKGTVTRIYALNIADNTLGEVNNGN